VGCFRATFSGAEVKKNDASQFKANFRRAVKLGDHAGEVGYDREHTPPHAFTFLTFSSQDEVPRSWFWALGKYRHGTSMCSKWAVENEAQGRIAEAVANWAAAFRFHTALGEFVLAREAQRRGAGLAGRLVGPSPFTGRLVSGEDESRMALDQGWDEPLGHVGPGLMLTWYVGSAYAMVARIHARMGRTDRALRRLASVIPALEKGSCWAENYVQIACDAAETLWLTGRTDHSETIERNLRAKVIAPDVHHPMRDGRLALARLCALQGRCDEAVEWFAKARTVLDEQGARPLRAIVDYDEGLMYMRRGAGGDRERARPLLDIALRQFRALGMPGWIRRAEGLLHDGKEWAPEASAHAPMADQPPPGPPLGEEREERTPAEHPPPDAHVFRKEGHFWTIAYAGALVRLKDTKGLQYLAHLLGHPGEECLALDLVTVCSGQSAVGSEEQRRRRLMRTTHEPALDAQAKAEYRARLHELRDELEEAEGFNDLGRMEKVQAEMQLISAQLSAAVGLHGRDRKGGTTAERARLMVTKRVKDALKQIAATNPALGHHLRACIKTGYVCTYTPSPDQPVEWSS
jgi:tetratricopeptide (TPR) repeat protein